MPYILVRDLQHTNIKAIKTKNKITLPDYMCVFTLEVLKIESQVPSATGPGHSNLAPQFKQTGQLSGF